MPVVVCPACAKKLQAQEAAAGKNVRCPGCGQTVPVPALAGSLSPVPNSASPGGESTLAHYNPDQVDDQSGLGTLRGKEDPDKTHGGPEALGKPAPKFTEFLAPPLAQDELGRLGPYRVLKILGHGGMGVVFLAEDVKLQRQVALKVMLPRVAEQDAAGKRFLREARIMAQVKHPHVVTIYQVDEDRGVPYLAMEFLEGESLEDRLQREGKLPMAEVVRLAREIAAGLQAAHKRGLIHRDIKPGNIWLEHQGSGDRGQGSEKPHQAASLSPAPWPLTPISHVKILDFGLARSGGDDSHITQTGVIVGTPAYMAPEQGRGEEVDARCDLFSLGVVLYRLCTGDLPFKASNAVSTLMAVASHQPRAPQLLNAAVPSALSDLIMKLLAKEPQDRFASAQALDEALAALPPAPVETREMAWTPGSSQPALRSDPTLLEGSPSATLVQTRSRWPMLGLALAIIALALLGFVWFWPTPTPNGKMVGEKMLQGEEASIHPGSPWRPLFNHKDLTGWMQPPLHQCDWKVVDGLLTAEGGHGVLFTEKMQPQDFHLRAEVKISARGDSGIFFRAQVPNFGTRSYEANIGTPAAGGEALNRWSGQRQTWKATKPQPVEEWFTLEIIAQGARLRVLQNGETVVDVTDQKPFIEEGHIGLQHFHADTGVWFRKVEIKDLSSSPNRYTNSLGMEFALVPKGKAWLGGGGGKAGDKEVEFKEDFYLGVYEVTQEEWQKVMGNNPSKFQAVAGLAPDEQKKLPVDQVSWEDAQAFLKRLNEQAKETGWRYRLPTEAEWEYACRGGPMADMAQSAFDYYLDQPALQLLPGQANFDFGKNLKRTSKVGSYKPNRLGLYDMHGNLWEWCDDPAPAPGGGPGRALRGGAWDRDPAGSRAGFAAALDPKLRSHDLGLRVARVRAADPDRRAAEWVLSIGGVVQVNDLGQHLHQTVELPKEPFRLTTVIAFGNDKMNDEGLAHFQDCMTLTHLDLGRTQVTAAGLVHFQGHRNLKALNLESSQVNDPGLKNIQGCKNLTNLNLASTKTGDAGLAYFQDFNNLVEITLHNTQVGDAGLVHFKDCKNLTYLGLKQTKVTAAKIDALKKAFPNCKIEWDGGVIQSQSKNRFTNSLGMQFALIPKGKAWLGGGDGKAGDKEVEFKDDFFLGLYEVTQEEWREIMKTSPSSFSRTGEGKIMVKDVIDEELKRYPVEMISWTDAQAFIDKLNQRDEQAGWIYRLPTAAEWEYACRGGPIAKSDSAFHFYFEKPANECLPAHANISNGLMRTCKAGSYPPNRLGLHDMHGNVWEWCHDAPGGARRILRGGGWQDLASSAQAAASITHDESSRFFSTGLRVARVPR